MSLTDLTVECRQTLDPKHLSTKPRLTSGLLLPEPNRKHRSQQGPRHRRYVIMKNFHPQRTHSSLLHAPNQRKILDFFYEIPQSAMHISQYFFSTRTELNLIDTTLVPQTSVYRIQQRSLPKQQTATNHSLHFEGKILLHVFFASLCLKVWSCNVTDPAIKMQVGTSSIDKIMRRIYPSERKVGPLHSDLMGILSTSKHRKLTLSQETALIKERKLGDHVKDLSDSIQVARQTVL